MKTFINKIIPFSELHIGILVRDEDPDFGVGEVIECDDIHNVLIEYEDGGTGLYCLDQSCEDYYPLYYL